MPYQRVDPARAREEAILLRASAVVAPIGGALYAVLFTALAVAHLITLTGMARGIMASTAMVTALTGAWVAWRWREPSHGQHAHVVTAVLVGMAIAGSLAHILLVPEVELTNGFIAVALGIGMLIKARRYCYSLLLVNFAAWSIGAAQLSEVANWAWFLVFASTIAVIAHEQLRRSTLQNLEREGVLQSHAAVLQGLMHSQPSSSGGADLFAPILDAARHTLGVARAGVWLFDADNNSIYSAGLVDEQDPDVGETRISLAAAAAPAYFAALNTERTVAAIDAHRHPATFELDAAYLVPNGVDAMLDSPILVDGELKGVLCLEHRGGERLWTAEEETFSASLAGLAAIRIQHEERTQLERRTRTAERLESLGLLAGGVAHDFNNLLTAVLGHAEMAIATGPEDDALQGHLQGIVSAASRAAELARKMLAYSGKATFVTQPVDLDRIADELLRGGSIDAPIAARVELVRRADLPPANADPVQVVQILLNLIGNSAEAGAEHIVLRTGTVTIDALDPERFVITDSLQPGEFVYIEAEDDGEGMAPEIRARMFDPFYSTKGVGHGLGMASVLGLMRVHGGTIELATSPAGGTRIRFLFPRSAGADAAALTVEPAGADQPAAQISQLRVLVVEDEPMVSSTIKAMLSAAGHSARLAGGVAELDRMLEACDGEAFDVALVDLTLIDGDGVDVVRRLRREIPDLPIVLMSGYDSSSATARLDRADAVHFLAKPFSLSELLERLQSAGG